MTDNRYNYLKEQGRWMAIFSELLYDHEYTRIMELYHKLLEDGIIKCTIWEFDENPDTSKDWKESRILMYTMIAYSNLDNNGKEIFIPKSNK